VRPQLWQFEKKAQRLGLVPRRFGRDDARRRWVCGGHKFVELAQGYWSSRGLISEGSAHAELDK